MEVFLDDDPYWKFTFDHLSYTFTDPEEVRKEIERRTDQLTESEKTVSSTKIILKIVSNKVVPLTLVDLPGLVKVF